VTVLGEGERSHRWPHFLPDGEAVLFISQASYENFDDASIEVVSLATGERKLVHEGGTQPMYVPTGHLVFARQGTLFATPFSLDRLETTASPASIIEGVMSGGTLVGGGSAQFAFSEGGMLVYISGVAEFENSTLTWVDRKGTPSPLSEQKNNYSMPRFSPDGRRLALSINLEDIWAYEIERGAMTRLTFTTGFDAFPVWSQIERGAMTRLTFTTGFDAFPVWSPDGERLAFSSSRDGHNWNLFLKRADGTGEAERLTESENQQRLTDWSPNGKVLAFSESAPETGWDIWLLPLEGEREPRPFLNTPFHEIYSRFSPDGRWLAYQSNESGRAEVYVRPYPGPGGKCQISTDGGRDPLWAPDGGELFYRHGDSMMVVPYTVEGESFRAGRSRELFRGQFQIGTGNLPYADIAPDGKGFVMLQRAAAKEEETEPTQVIVVTNWSEELTRLVPK
jgi:serine/threonine-protein kinase